MFYLRFVSFLLFFVIGHLSYGQYDYIPVFKNLKNEELLDSLISGYKSFSLLPYSTCRDTLFAKIDARNDSLECIYTGMKRYIPPGADPTDAVLLNGQPNGINTEHAYPQSKGASGYGRSDMHILYPSRVRTNSNRSNNPLGEIPDQQTTIWYYLTQEMNSPPSSNRDLYSESTSTKFEPRESVKGNFARSIFYFYTMYKADAQLADPAFFNLQVNDLCLWHYMDPVDSTEWRRNQLIHSYQGNLNPFVLDCSLASRTYCPSISDACLALTNVSELQNDLNSLILYPNPGNGELFLDLRAIAGKYLLYIKNAEGQILITEKGESKNEILHFSLSANPPGLYFIHFYHAESKTTQVFKYVLTK